MRQLERWQVLIAAAAVVGTGLWLALVPTDDTSGQARNASYWWLVALAAFILGALARCNESAFVGGAVGVPALLLAGWTAPRGDEDGLWLLWFPLLALLIFGLMIAGAVGGALAERIAARRRS